MESVRDLKQTIHKAHGVLNLATIGLAVFTLLLVVVTALDFWIHLKDEARPAPVIQVNPTPIQVKPNITVQLPKK